MSDASHGAAPGVDRAADRAQDSDWTDRAAVAGLVAFGVVHLVVGWLAVQLAFGDRSGSASSTGALRRLAQQPFGTVLIWLVAVGMVLLVGWQVVEALTGHRDHEGASRVRHRLLSAGKAVVYGAVAVSALQIATSSGTGGGTDSTTATLMNAPAGQLLVALVGLGIVAVGVALLVAAVREKYLEHLDAAGRSGRSGTLYRWLGRAGHAAKGVALLVVGGLFLVAAATHEAKRSGGLDQALATVVRQPYGPVLLTLLGIGIACYGAFCLAEARHLER